MEPILHSTQRILTQKFPNRFLCVCVRFVRVRVYMTLFFFVAKVGVYYTHIYIDQLREVVWLQFIFLRTMLSM